MIELKPRSKTSDGYVYKLFSPSFHSGLLCSGPRCSLCWLWTHKPVLKHRSLQSFQSPELDVVNVSQVLLTLFLLVCSYLILLCVLILILNIAFLSKKSLNSWYLNIFTNLIKKCCIITSYKSPIKWAFFAYFILYNYKIKY